MNQTFDFKSLFNSKRWKFKSDKVSFRYTYLKYKNSPPLVYFAIVINKASIRETLYLPINMVINKHLADSKPFFPWWFTREINPPSTSSFTKNGRSYLWLLWSLFCSLLAFNWPEIHILALRSFLKRLLLLRLPSVLIVSTLPPPTPPKKIIKKRHKCDSLSWQSHTKAFISPEKKNKQTWRWGSSWVGVLHHSFHKV